METAALTAAVWVSDERVQRRELEDVAVDALVAGLVKRGQPLADGGVLLSEESTKPRKLGAHEKTRHCPGVEPALRPYHRGPRPRPKRRSPRAGAT